MQVSGLFLYPVKSLRGYAVDEAVVEARGLRGDRRFMVVDPDGTFMTQRDRPQLSQISARLENGDLVLRHPDHGSVRVPAIPGGREPMEVRVWQSEVTAECVSDEVDAWLRNAVGEPARLVAMPESTRRPVEPEFDRGGDIVSFADGYPCLLVGDESLADLNDRLPRGVTMERFRPNITVAGAEPFAEDGWRTVRIGSGSFHGPKTCARCVVTTIDPETGVKGKEPLATLATYRNVGGNVLMGANLVPNLPSGGAEWTVRVGDDVTPLDIRESKPS